MSKLAQLKLKKKLGGGSTNKSSGGIANKFKKRSQNVLDKTYEERNERSKGSGTGRPIFNQELMADFGIEDFQTTTGDRFVEVLPISFNSEIPYFKELSVHFGVGLNNDAFICSARYNRQRCYRCERQSVMWKELEKYGGKDKVKQLYPADRCCYLFWERTEELINGDSPNYTFKIWAAPKKKVHKEIQEKTRGKLSRVTLDISDVHDGGDGRTIAFSIAKEKKDSYPTYSGFELIPRETPIPQEVLEKLDTIISAAEEAGYDNAIEMFFNLHEYDELKEAMASEEEMDDSTDNKKEESSAGECKGFSNRGATTQSSNDTSPEEELMNELEELREHLESLVPNKFKWKAWLKENGYYDDAAELDPAEAIPLIIDDMYEKAIADM